MTPAEIGIAEVGIGCCPRVEQQTVRRVAGEGAPVVRKFHKQGVRLAPQCVGGCVTEHAPLGLLGDKGHHGRLSTVTFGHPVVLQIALLAARRDGVEIEMEV